LLLRAIEYRAAPFEVAVHRVNGRTTGKRTYGASAAFAGSVSAQWPPRQMCPRAIHLSCGSSTETGLPDQSVDLVVTDPPFFDNVHYSELADFFFAWQQLDSFPFKQNRIWFWRLFQMSLTGVFPEHAASVAV
jgi:putative DNA methylase